MTATRKTEKYSTLSSAYRFEPIAVENLGVFNSTTLNFIYFRTRPPKLCSNRRCDRDFVLIRTHISIMLQRFNSVLLHDTLPVDLPDLWPSDILILAFLVLTPGIFSTWGIKNNNNNNNNHDNVYGAIIITMTKVIARVLPVHLMKADWAPGGCQSSDQAKRLGLWVRRKLAATIHIHHRHCYCYSARRSL